MFEVVKQLQGFLTAISKDKRLVVAYSGGIDSHVLLHAMSFLNQTTPHSLRAIHIHHGLNAKADAWAKHCGEVCRELGVELTVDCIDARANNGESPEAYARELRYRTLQKHLSSQDILLTAHHQDDQAETLLLQLCRGAGPKGLCAMPMQKTLGKALLMRPLLTMNRRDIEAYAQAHQLTWLDDDSNSNERFDRNYIRHTVMPLFSNRWPSVSTTFSRAATLQANAAELIHDVALQDWLHVRAEQSCCIHISKLQQLSLVRQFEVIRYALQQNDLNMPSQTVLSKIFSEVIESACDANACLSWKGAEIRRYQDLLYFQKPLLTMDNAIKLDWKYPSQALKLPFKLGTMTLQHQEQAGLKLPEDALIQVCFRQGGEKIQLPNKTHQQRVKRLMQEWEIPPWERGRIPLLYVNNELAAIPGYAVAQKFYTESCGWQLVWERL